MIQSTKKALVRRQPRGEAGRTHPLGIRAPVELIERIDAQIATRDIPISRTLWIVEALYSTLAQQEAQAKKKGRV
jgi:hypothetical protein